MMMYRWMKISIMLVSVIANLSRSNPNKPEAYIIPACNLRLTAVSSVSMCHGWIKRSQYSRYSTSQQLAWLTTHDQCFWLNARWNPKWTLEVQGFSGFQVVIAYYDQSPPRCRQNASFRSTSNNLVREVIASLLLPNFRDSHAKVGLEPRYVSCLVSAWVF